MMDLYMPVSMDHLRRIRVAGRVDQRDRALRAEDLGRVHRAIQTAGRAVFAATGRLQGRADSVHSDLAAAVMAGRVVAGLGKARVGCRKISMRRALDSRHHF
jgi:hypothetical protein